MSNYKLWRSLYKAKKEYCTRSRYLFYDIAAKYLPTNKEAIILDIGSGEALFASYHNLENKYENIYLLDGNKEIINHLRKGFNNAILYTAPERLPFKDSTVSYIHCSHLVEHLYFQELYELLREIDRVLEKNGILVISSPLFYYGFYNDLSHTKPYNPTVFLKYLCYRGKNRSKMMISEYYSVLELVYRYKTLDNYDEGWGSSLQLVDFLIYFTKRILTKLKIKYYKKTGFTLVLKKTI